MGVFAVIINLYAWKPRDETLGFILIRVISAISLQSNIFQPSETISEQILMIPW